MAANEHERDAKAQGPFCDCEFCVRDGPHEPSCRVHRSPPEECDCGRTEQMKGAS